MITEKHFSLQNKVLILRTKEEIFFPVVSLLIHELTHANDYFPRSFYLDNKSLNLRKTYSEISKARLLKLELLSNNQPTSLYSEKLFNIGKILYHGKSATEEDNLINAIEVANEFEKDLATDFYSYSSTREDMAMHTEESLMLYYYNIFKFVSVIEYPYSNFVKPKEYQSQIIWGQKGRVLVPAIKDRALYAIEQILGNKISKKVSEKFENLSEKEIPAYTFLKDIYNL